jgi:antitoxin component of MazEF toxin-antitoxin module
MIRMPLIQKIIQIGDSRAVTIPASWLAYYERQKGQTIKEVAVEVNGKLTIRPILKEAQRNEEKEQKSDNQL